MGNTSSFTKGINLFLEMLVGPEKGLFFGGVGESMHLTRQGTPGHATSEYGAAERMPCTLVE